MKMEFLNLIKNQVFIRNLKRKLNLDQARVSQIDIIFT